MTTDPNAKVAMAGEQRITNRIPTRLYGASLQNVAAGATARSLVTFATDGKIIGLCGSQSMVGGAPPTVNNYFRVNLAYQTEDVVFTQAIRFEAVIGNANFPMFFKNPLLVKKQQTLSLTVQNMSVGGFMNCDVAFIFLPEKVAHKPLVAATQMYDVNFTGIPIGSEVQNPLSFNRDGYIWAIQGVGHSALLVAFIQFSTIQIRLQNLDYLHIIPMAFSSVVGNAQHPFWLPRPIFINANQTINVTIQNNEAVPITDLDVVLHFVPKDYAEMIPIPGRG